MPNLVSFRISGKVAVHELSHEDYSKPFKVPFAQGSFLVCKTDLFKQLNGFDESYFMYLEDADLCRRMNQISDVMYCPYTTVEHRWEKDHIRIFIYSEYIFKAGLNTLKMGIFLISKGVRMKNAIVLKNLKIMNPVMAMNCLSVDGI